MGDTNQSKISDVGKKRDEDDEDALDFLHFGGLRKGQSSKKRVASTTLSLTPVDANRRADGRLSRSYRS